MPTPTLATQFTAFAADKLEDSLANIRRCVELLDDEGVWWRPNEVSNSIGNLLLHLTGNVRQWIVAGLGGETFDRDRPAEFSDHGSRPVDEIVADLADVVTRAATVIRSLDEPALVAVRAVQYREVTGTAIVFHVVEHFSLHTGQIVSTTKLRLNRDLSLYDPEGRRLTGADPGVP